MQISGIGPKLSARIVKFRDRLGGFLVEEQLYDVYELEAEVVKRTLERFKVETVPKVEKIAINTASAQELSKLVYISFDLAREIVAYRNQNGPFSDLDDLSNVTSFPEERFERIKLYLTL
jgi:competence ComEA-like helix-hairpin-helix protein